MAKAAEISSEGHGWMQSAEASGYGSEFEVQLLEELKFYTTNREFKRPLESTF